MTDELTQKRITVSEGTKGGPYLVIPFSQLEAVKQLLDQHAIVYWPDPMSISVNGKPPVIFINFSERVQGNHLQEILDSVE